MAQRITKARLACLPWFYRRLVLDGQSQMTIENLDTNCHPRAVLWNLPGFGDRSPSVFQGRAGRQLPVVVHSEYWSDDFFDFLDGDVRDALLRSPDIAKVAAAAGNRRLKPAIGMLLPRRVDLRFADELFRFTPYRAYFDLWLGLADSWPPMRGIRRV